MMLFCLDGKRQVSGEGAILSCGDQNGKWVRAHERDRIIIPTQTKVFRNVHSLIFSTRGRRPLLASFAREGHENFWSRQAIAEGHCRSSYVITVAAGPPSPARRPFRGFYRRRGEGASLRHRSPVSRERRVLHRATRAEVSTRPDRQQWLRDAVCRFAFLPRLRSEPGSL